MLVVERQAPDPAINGIVVDFAVSLIMDMCRMNAGSALRPLAVGLQRSRPKDSSPYRRFFGCPVHFGAEEDTIALSHKDVDRILPSSNRQIAATMDRILVERLAGLDKSDVVTRCQAHLLEQLSSGEISEEAMANQLHMSRRTLQRRLASADLTYKQLVDDTRRDLATRHLDDPRHSITDVTFLLGFSQQSAFTRAFKRWTGLTPVEYRQNKQQGD